MSEIGGKALTKYRWLRPPPPYLPGPCFALRSHAGPPHLAVSGKQPRLTERAAGRENGWDDWVAFWKVWIPGDIIVFGMVPMWARLPTNNAISFMYVLVLSFMRGAPDDP